MPKAVKIVLGCVVGLLALYGVFVILSSLLTESRGKEAAKAVHPFVSGVAAGMKEEAKESLNQTPDEQLEKEAYEVSKKMYPVLKGTLLGLAEAFAKDPRRDEFPARMRDAGKAFGEVIVGPFAEGFAEGSGDVLGQLNRTLGGVRKLGDSSKDVVDAIADGIGKLKDILDGRPPPVAPDRQGYPESSQPPQYQPPDGQPMPPGQYQQPYQSPRRYPEDGE